MNGREDLVEEYADLLNCKRMRFPFVYLGIEVGANPRKASSWKVVIEKIQNRLTPWKSKTLSFGARLCLLNSVLSSIPLFYLSFYKIPLCVANKIRRIQSHFLWGGVEEGRKIHWVKWEEVCRHKDVGGLGVKDVVLFNKSLLAKWRWRALVGEDGLWVRVLQARLGASLKLGGGDSFRKG